MTNTLTPFMKMHGLGNDFVVMDGVTRAVVLDAATIIRLADRRTGIGFDQLLLLLPPEDPEADLSCRIYNADGSVAQQCGNGMRCVALFARQTGLINRPKLVIAVGDVHIACQVQEDAVQVDMGQPVFAPDQIPLCRQHLSPAAKAPPLHGYHLDCAAGALQVWVLSMGNPHAVLFVKDCQQAQVCAIGSELQSHPAFPAGVNVSFCRVIDSDNLQVRVFERGAGETAACGSAACAVHVAARCTGRVADESRVHFPGGALHIAWQPGARVCMTGAATAVYQGRVELPAETA